jgi:molybdate transport system permease protein
MIGGNIPGRTQVVSVVIFNHVEALDYGSAHLLSAGMVLFSFAVLWMVHTFNRGGVRGAL